MFDAINNTKYFSLLDASRYWQTPIKEEEKSKTGFSTREELFQFKVLPFGLKNASALF
jgi:hypothetical protein